MFLQSLVKLNTFISVRNFAILVKAKKKKVFAAFWFYISLEFQISCCQVGITCQNTDGTRHILPPSVSDLREHCPPPQINAYDYNTNFLMNNND